MKIVHILDLPLRLFHWLLVLAFIGAYVTASLGGTWMDWHGRIGLFILGLLVFRVVWGFIGSPHARFSSFFPTFSRLKDYLNGRWQGAGHNPLGGLSVLALLGVLGAHVVSGLFANDDIAFQGPLYTYIEKDLSDKLTGWHSTLFYILLGFVALHVLTIFYYRWVKKTNLVKPMLTGKKEIPLTLEDSVPPIHSPGAGAIKFIFSILVSFTVIWSVTGGITKFYPAAQADQSYSEF